MRLTSEESLDGYYIHHAVQTLFALIRDGFDGTQRGGAADLLAAEPGAHLHHGFRIRALDSALFREGSTPLLDRVKLRNHVLQQVIRLMSLTRPAKGRRGRRGRISYAQLGINQLGAVYEVLLSYRGFFAEENLYEVKKAGEPDDPLKSAWFVPARDLDDYTEDERVYDKDDEGRRKLRVHPRGRFIYRLAGRDRQKTASYYTPESLTRCVVKYALRELVSDDMPADRILDLTVCEPAMGSAAFLNEAVNQLAEKYLERKQRELGRRIPHAEYADELQQVKHYIADRNVYGVDLNPVARELAEVSLWLNCIHQSGHVPWFGYQLVCGNSLVGARRQVFPAATLGERNRKSELWFNHAPERVTPPSESSRRCTATNSSHVRDAAPTRAPKRPAGTVYHFLLPDPGMTAYSDKAAKALEPQCFQRIAGWRKRFFKPFAEDEIAELEALSDRVDALWALHAEQLARDHRETEDALPVCGRRAPADERHTTNTWKDRIRNQGVFSQDTRTASPYRAVPRGRLRGRLRPSRWRLRAHFQFHNEKKLFAEVDHHTLFSINVYGAQRSAPRSTHIANLFAPATVDACLDHDGHGAVPGFKDDDNQWNTAGHANRVVVVDPSALHSFAKLYDEPGTPPERVRLPALHAQTLLAVLRKLAAHPRRLGDLREGFRFTRHWNETESQRDGTIRRETRFPADPVDLVLSGPHFFAGNPLSKTPRATCTQNSHYDVLDLTALPDNYLPRTNYAPACEPAEYRRRAPRVPWCEPGETTPRLVTAYYRVLNREMVGPSAERTLITTLIPKEVAHILTTVASVFRDAGACLDFAALSMSLVLDFFVKSTGTGHVQRAWLSRLPILTDRCRPRLRSALRLRALRLCCLTVHYADLWRDACRADMPGTSVPYLDAFRADAWTRRDPRLPPDFNALPPQCGATWRCAPTMPAARLSSRSTFSAPSPSA